MRMALLGSPGLGVVPRLPFRVAPQLGLTVDNPASAKITGAAATYAAVVAGHHLDLTFNGIPGTVVVPFTGAEAAEADFLLAINAVLNLLGSPLPFGAPAGAVDKAGQIQLIAPFFGTFSGGTVAATTSADVQASLGIAPGAFAAATGGVQTVGGQFARQMGGYKTAGAGFIQRFQPIFSSRSPSLVMLDRGVAAAVLSDNPRYGPAYT